MRCGRYVSEVTLRDRLSTGEGRVRVSSSSPRLHAGSHGYFEVLNFDCDIDLKEPDRPADGLLIDLTYYPCYYEL
jgi:hypothetical protein